MCKTEKVSNHSNFGFDSLLKSFENQNYVWNCFCYFSFGFMFDNFEKISPCYPIQFFYVEKNRSFHRAKPTKTNQAHSTWTTMIMFDCVIYFQMSRIRQQLACAVMCT